MTADLKKIKNPNKDTLKSKKSMLKSSIALEKKIKENNYDSKEQKQKDIGLSLMMDEYLYLD